MFSLFSKKPTDNPAYREFKADMHSHLLPGIDDGSPDTRSSIELIKGMMKLGYSKLITTPHVLGDMYPNSTELINEKLALLKEAVAAEGLDVELHAAAEYFLDERVDEMLKNREPLLTLKNNWVLVEFSMAYRTHGLKDILFELQMQGYQPVIAHPERYIYLQQGKQFYDELKDIGCLFQLNILSLTPHYGRAVNELAHYLIKKEYYDLAGSDLHHMGHIEALGNPKLVQPLQRLVESGKMRNAELV